MTERVRVSAVSFLNTAPFVFGLQQSFISNSIILSTDYPAECARKLINNQVDVGLVPAATLLSLQNSFIVSEYCLGSMREVRTVSLLSNSPLESISTIFLDFQSRSSNLLTKILAKHHWKREINWVTTSQTPIPDSIGENQAMVAIGDKVFELENRFKFNYDLATEWNNFTSLPMVFAVWLANKELDKAFINSFNEALRYGIERIPEAVQLYSINHISSQDAQTYLTKNISYSFDEGKRKALDLFLKLGKEFSPG